MAADFANVEILGAGDGGQDGRGGTHGADREHRPQAEGEKDDENENHRAMAKSHRLREKTT